MPEPKDLNSILSEIRGEVDYKNDPYAFKSQRLEPIPTKIDTGKVEDVKYNVHTDAIYDRLNDGTYIPKFENYKGGIGNEDRLASEQSGFEQLWHGVTKAAAKTFNYALDATVGTVYGIYNAISEGEWEGLYDNDFSNTLDDWNKQLDYSLPNYYSNEQKSMGVLESMTTVNFWANDVAGGLAFVGGALLPEVAISAATAGASAPLTLSKLGFKAGTKGFLKAGSDKLVKEGIEAGLKTGFKEGIDKTGVNLIRSHRLAKAGEYTGEVFKTAGFLVRTSNFEAGMEARHNLHDSVSDYLGSFKELNGRAPTFEEYSEFLDEAVHASNWVYGANMAILSVSNMAMFGSKFGVGINLGKKFNNFGNRAIGLGVTKEAGKKTALAGASKFQKALGNSYLILSKPAIEGLYEEGLQGVAGKTMQNYLKAKYDPDYEQGYGLWSAITDSFSEQYQSKEGWKEMAIGMIIGMGAPLIQGQAPSGFGKNSRKAREAQIQGEIDVANQGQQLLKNIDRANSMYEFRLRMENEDTFDQDSDISSAIINTDFIKSQEHLKTVGEIEEDFNAIVDNMNLTPQQVEDLGGVENAELYRETLKDNFARDAKNYRTAKSLVKSLGLSGKLKDTPGNIQEIGEALTMNIMVGKTSMDKAKSLANQIESLVGVGGLFDHMEHYNNLEQDQKNKIKDLRKKKRRLRDLRKLAIKYGQQAEGAKIRTGRSLKESTIQNNYLKFSEKLALTNNQITELDQEISEIAQSIDSQFRAENFSIDATVATDPSLSTTEGMIEQLDYLQNYIDSLEKVGKKQDAATLNYLIGQFKTYSDAHRQMNSDIRRMMDTNFFSKTKEGKAFKNTVLGRKYVMSEEFRDLIRENDRLIDQSLKKAGVKGYNSVEEYIQNTLEENEELSEREKYRRESVVRVILGAKRLRESMAEAQTNYEEIIESIQEPTSKDPLKGDTIRLSRSIGPQGKDLSNLDVINEMITDISDQINALKRVAGVEEDIVNLEKRRDDLMDLEVEQEIEEGDYKKALKALEVPAEDLTEEQAILLDTYEKFLLKEQELRSVEMQLEDLKKNKSFKIIGSPEYKRLRDLTKRKQDQTITPEELEEMDRLSEEVDQWLIITGTVVEGLRLSDLIRQKAVLEDTEIADLEDVAEVTDQEVIDQINISDKTRNVNYSYGQTFEGVTAVNTPEGIEISGIRPEAFSDLTGVQDFRVNKQGNIIISQEVQELLNAGGIVSVLPTNKDLTTNYSVVLRTQLGFNGELETRPLMSSFNADFNGEMNPDAIYDLSNGEDLVLEVNPEDVYNQDLLSDFAKAIDLGGLTKEVTKESLEEALSEDTKYQDLTLDLEVLEDEESRATTDRKPSITKKKNKKKEAVAKRVEQVRRKLEKEASKNSSKKSLKDVQKELRRALVIRVKDQSGNMVAVLKAKRNTEGIKSREALQFEALRDQIASNTDFLKRLVQTGVSEVIPVEGNATVKKVYLGHPNFNFVRNEDATVSIESRAITEQQVQHISDIGYVQNGKLFTKSKNTGINTTFLNKSMQDKNDSKIPFVVLKKGETVFAYPVKLRPQEKGDLKEFRDIYDSELRPVDKAIALNTYMAERGVDIKQPGNSFTVFNMQTDDQFFNQKLAQLESIDYYSKLDSWVDPKVSIEASVVGQASINIDPSNALHSPKVQMDFSGLQVESEPVVEDMEDTDNNDKNTIQSGSGVDNFLRKCK